MATSFSQLKKQTSDISSIQSKLKSSQNGFQEDERFWRIPLNDEGTGSAVIRFLPAAPGEEDPFVKLYSFSFKGPTGKWFIENCPSTIGKPCPVLEENGKLWNSGIESDKDIARERKRRASYITNVLIIKDPANPENNGKVKLFKFGPMIFEKLENTLMPKFEDDSPINIFDPWEGANFKLRITRKDKYANYETSSFDQPSPISEDDAEIERIWKEEHSLKQFIAEDQFKSYEVLENKYLDVISATNKNRSTANKTVKDDSVSEEDIDEMLDNAINKSKDNTSNDDLEELMKLIDE